MVSKLAAAYYVVPAATLVANLAFVVPAELKLPFAERGSGRLTEPLSPASRCARWNVVEGLAAAPAAGRMRLRVVLENCGDRTWPDEAWAGPVELWGVRAVHVAARWTPEGTLAPEEYLPWRGPLPHAVLPGHHVDTELYVPAPSKPGRYVLELTLVQELVGFFDEGRARPVRMSVEVR